MNIEKKDLLLYAVTDRKCLRGISLEEAVEQALLTIHPECAADAIHFFEPLPAIALAIC